MSVYRTLEEGGKVDWRVSTRLFRFAFPHRRLVVASIAIMVVASIAGVVQPYLAKLAMDEGIIAGQLDVLGLATNRRGILHSFHHLADVETRGFLPLREFLE